LFTTYGSRKRCFKLEEDLSGRVVLCAVIKSLLQTVYLTLQAFPAPKNRELALPAKAIRVHGFLTCLLFLSRRVADLPKNTGESSFAPIQRQVISRRRTEFTHITLEFPGYSAQTGGIFFNRNEFVAS